MPFITRRAHAKVNLALSVGPPLPPGTRHAGRDASGFHPIASWVAPIDLADAVTVSRGVSAGPLSIAWAPDAPRKSPIGWPTQRDLAWRAVRSLESAAGIGPEFRVRVEKRIPVGGGLGGGSSDAAAALLAANALLDAPLPPDHLAAIALSLGSDVPFFLDDAPPRPAIVTGLGDAIRRVPRHPAAFLLVVPTFGCPTGAVYRAFGSAPGAGPDEPRVRALIDAGVIDPRAFFNDLAPPASDTEPRLAALVAALGPLGAVHMTGSGSCLLCFSADVPGVKLQAASADPGAVVIPARLV